MSFPTSLKPAAWFEGTTLLVLLLLAVPLKYCYSEPSLVRLVGPVHGLAFLAYIHQVVRATARGTLDFKQSLKFVVAGFLPGGTFVMMSRGTK